MAVLSSENKDSMLRPFIGDDESITFEAKVLPISVLNSSAIPSGYFFKICCSNFLSFPAALPKAWPRIAITSQEYAALHE